MKDSQGNNFGVGDTLRSTQSNLSARPITCKCIYGDVATMVCGSYDHDEFNINQDSLLSSYWIKCEKEKAK